MNLLIVIGYVAAILTAIVPLPQIIKAIKTKSTEDISMLMLILMAILLLLWTIYGVYLEDLPLILGDGVALIFTLIVIGLKLKYESKKK